MRERFQLLSLEKRLEASPQKDKVIALLDVVPSVFLISNLVAEWSLYPQLLLQGWR